jgi:D-amino-acid dehydrogenase
MARTDVMVLGAGIVGTSTALQLAKRGVSVALVDRRGPGEQTSYGNAGVIGGAGVYPTAFPDDFGAVLRIALKRSPLANYHLSFLPKVLPWLLAFRAWSKPGKLVETARIMRPLLARALGEHEILLRESGAERFLRKEGWLSIYRSGRDFAALEPELELGASLGVTARKLDPDGARALEPSLNPVFRHAIHWPDIASVSNPLAVTRAYAAHLTTLGGVVVKGDARSLHRADGAWRVETDEGPVDARQAVVALGPWAPDLLAPLGIRLPLAVKRGYHRHFRPRGNAALTRPVVDPENGYALAPMEQGVRLTTGAELADRDAPPTPVQLGLVTPVAKNLFPLGEPVEEQPWLGSRPCFADSRPVVGPAPGRPGRPGLWLCYGHGHYGLTLGPITGRLLAEMMIGTTPVMDPAPFSAERFG